MKHRSAKLSRLSPLPWALASCGAPAKSIPLRPLNGEHHIWLVLKSILKNDGVRQWGWDDIPYMKWKIKAMFETTNQLLPSWDATQGKVDSSSRLINP